jgi:hypothetical protein
MSCFAVLGLLLLLLLNTLMWVVGAVLAEQDNLWFGLFFAAGTVTSSALFCIIYNLCQ